MLLTAYLFHIEALADVKDSYAKIQFLRRYPERFKEKLRFPAFFLCAQQIFIAVFCETLNITFLCAQTTYLDLIMNYVALAGVLQIDDAFMATQERIFADVCDRIENPDKYLYLKLFKDTKHHDIYGFA
jgi:hypothetical protein